MADKIYKFSNGLPFLSPLDRTLDDLRKRIEGGKGSLCFIDGIPGEGKSTLAVECLEYYQRADIDYKDQYAMGFKEFVNKFKICIKNQRKVIIYDEAGDYNKRGWASSINKHINRLFEIYRKFGIFVIMVQPHFYKIDLDLLITGVPRLLLHCHGRNLERGKIKAYGLDRMFWLKKWMSQAKIPNKSYAYNIVRPNYHSSFLDLTPIKAQKLDQVSTQGKSDVFEELDIKEQGLMDYVKIAQFLDRSVIWVKNKVSEMNLKPDRVYKRKKYFTREVVWELREKLGVPGGREE